MQNIPCKDVCGTNCQEPLGGSDTAELKKNIFLHLARAHPEMALPETQRRIAEKIDTLFHTTMKI